MTSTAMEIVMLGRGLAPPAAAKAWDAENARTTAAKATVRSVWRMKILLERADAC